MKLRLEGDPDIDATKDLVRTWALALVSFGIALGAIAVLWLQWALR